MTVKQFYRKKNLIVVPPSNGETTGGKATKFPSINAAKRESRQMQKDGWKVVPKEQRT